MIDICIFPTSVQLAIIPMYKKEQKTEGNTQTCNHFFKYLKNLGKFSH